MDLMFPFRKVTNTDGVCILYPSGRLPLQSDVHMSLHRPSTGSSHVQVSEPQDRNHLQTYGPELRAGVCHPCFETELTANEKSASDSD